MTPQKRRELTDIVYVSLFGKNTTALLIYFSLSPLCLRDEWDVDLRECFGELALQAIEAIEKDCKDTLECLGHVSDEKVTEVVQYHANQIAIEAKAQAAGMGIDLLTGVEFGIPSQIE